LVTSIYCMLSKK